MDALVVPRGEATTGMRSELAERPAAFLRGRRLRRDVRRDPRLPETLPGPEGEHCCRTLADVQAFADLLHGQVLDLAEPQHVSPALRKREDRLRHERRVEIGVRSRLRRRRVLDRLDVLDGHLSAGAAPADRQIPHRREEVGLERGRRAFPGLDGLVDPGEGLGHQIVRIRRPPVGARDRRRRRCVSLPEFGVRMLIARTSTGEEVGVALPFGVCVLVGHVSPSPAGVCQDLTTGAGPVRFAPRGVPPTVVDGTPPQVTAGGWIVGAAAPRPGLLPQRASAPR